jgi:hypothetical protein
MPTPFWTRLIIGLTAALWLLIAFVLDVPVDKNWLKALGGIGAAIVGALLLFDYWAWRLLPAGILRRPKLHGTWKATLHYQWPEGTPTKTKPCYIVIRQTYSAVSVEMLFDISASQSRSASIVNENGRRSLWFSYWSAATALEREGNPPHRGGAELVISRKPRRLEGDYWTERKTRGRIVTEGHTGRVYDTYEGAQSGEYQ